MKVFIEFSSGLWEAKDRGGVVANAYDNRRHGDGRVELFQKLRDLGYTIAVINGEENKLVAAPVAA